MKIYFNHGSSRIDTDMGKAGFDKIDNVSGVSWNKGENGLRSA
ncbi:MAG: hypothetical protein ABSG59_16945 [Verrucomicrobiota bacterium]